MSRSKSRIRRKTKNNTKRRLRGGYGEKVLVDTLCNQANEQTLDKVPELKGIVKGICKGESDSTESSANNNNNNNASNNGLLDAAGGFLSSTGATDMASKAIKGFGSVATLPMRIAFGALGKITGFNPMNNATNTDSNNLQTNTDNTNLQGGNKDVTKLIEKLNTIDKKYLGAEIVEELKNFGQSGGKRRSTRSRRSKRSKRSRKIRKSRNNKKSLKKRKMKGGGGSCPGSCMTYPCFKEEKNLVGGILYTKYGKKKANGSCNNNEYCCEIGPNKYFN